MNARARRLYYILIPVYSQIRSEKKRVFEVAGRGCGPEVARGQNIRFAALVSSVPETESIECRTGKLETGRKRIVAPVKIADVILLRRNFEFGVQ